MTDEDEPKPRGKKPKPPPEPRAQPCREITGVSHWSGDCLMCGATRKQKCKAK